MERDYLQELSACKEEYLLPLGGIISDTHNFFDRDKELITNEDIHAAYERIDMMRGELAAIDSGLEEDSEVPSDYRGLIESAIEFLDTELRMLRAATMLEAEKQGYELTSEVRNELQTRVGMMQSQLYGEQISGSEEELQLVSYLEYLLRDNPASEFEHLQKFVQTRQPSDRLYIPSLQMPDGPQIPRKDYFRIFELGFEFLGLKDWKVQSAPRSFISVNSIKKIVYIPNREQYYTLSVKRICELLEHEVGTHVVRGDGMSKTLKSTLANYLQLEEGIAMTAEQMTSRNLSELDIDTPTIHHISTYIAENCTLNETIAILTDYYTLVGTPNPAMEALSRAKRVKRYNSNSLPGANRKDIVYRRGLREVVKYLREHPDPTSHDYKNDIKRAYLSKLGTAEILTIDPDEIMKYFEVDEKTMVKPLWIGQVLYRKFFDLPSTDLPITNQYLSYVDKRAMVAQGKNDIKRQMFALLNQNQE